MVFFTRVRCCCNRHERERQDTKDKSLNHTDENLQAVENEWEGKEEERHDEKHYLTSENVAEQSEGKRNNLADLAHEFDESNKDIE